MCVTTTHILKLIKIQQKINDIHEMLTRWKKNEYITNNTYNEIYCSNGNLPRAYGLLKIHKSGFTFRIIISSINSPTYAIANYVHRIISKNKPHSYIENSYQLVKKLNVVY